MPENINGYTDIYGLLGYPARHSYSPVIHNYLFKKNSINSVYLAFEIKPDNFKECVSCFKILKFKGFNLTMPFKKDIIPYLDKISRDASIINSVNTVVRTGDIYEGFNTDLDGFIKSLEEKEFNFTDSCALVLGAGSTAGSTVLGLLKKKVKKIYLFNRTADRAFELKDRLRKYFDEEIIILENLKYLGSEDLKRIDLVVNCTSVGMDGLSGSENMPVPENWCLKDKFVFEMIYKPAETMFLIKAKSEKAVIINGLDMLVNQALASFEIWEGFFPDKKDLMEYFKNSVK